MSGALGGEPELLESRLQISYMRLTGEFEKRETPVVTHFAPGVRADRRKVQRVEHLADLGGDFPASPQGLRRVEVAYGSATRGANSTEGLARPRARS